MFDIDFNDSGQVVMGARLDASQAQRAEQFFDAIMAGCVVDVSGLDRASSAGPGVRLRTHRRLMAGKSGLELVSVGSHTRGIFRCSAFDRPFVMRPAGVTSPTFLAVGCNFG